MSHFTVTVVTPSVPTQDELAAVLQPFHEFECTGIEDEYVVDVDKTQEALDEYEKATEVRLKGPDGVLHDRFDDKGKWKPEFSKPADFGRREEFVPPGFERVEVPAKDVETAAKWICGYYGWPIAGKDAGEKFKYGRIEVDGEGNVVKCIDRTNPNKQWDWWVIGGRWKGHLRLKSGAKADQATLDQIDLASMRGEAAALSGATWDRVHRVAGDLPQPEAWEAVRERVGRDNIAVARDEYWGQPAIKAIKAEFRDQWGIEREIEALSSDRETYCQMGADGAVSTFAFLKDGQWVERGDMGWFGVVHDEMDGNLWDRKFNEMIDGLPPEACLTIVDCHI